MFRLAGRVFREPLRLAVRSSIGVVPVAQHLNTHTATASTSTSTTVGTRVVHSGGFKLTISVAGCPKHTRVPVGLGSSESDDPRTCGEDAFLAKADGASGLCVAVMDGVGGWASVKGVDPGAVSHALMAHLGVILAAKGAVSALELLSAAWERTHSQSGLAGGSTTACVALLKPGREGGGSTLEVDVVNVGDSGLYVIREAQTVFSAEETHAEPTKYVPCQLAVIPRSLEGGGYVESVPRDGSVATFPLQAGDWIVVASDGVIDNLQMASLGPAFLGCTSDTNAALQLVEAALRGPKVDDITAVVVHVGAETHVNSKL